MMKVFALLPFLFAFNAIAAPSPVVESPRPKHTTQDVLIDIAIISALDRMFTSGGLKVDQTSGLLSTRDVSPASELYTRSPVSRRQSSDVRNDLVSGICDDVIVIWARGTNGSGNLGTGIGPSFINAVAAAKPGEVIAQGVAPYPADVWGYLQGGSPEGSRSMANLTQRAATQCPGAKIVLAGYSQGAQVTHNAAGIIPTTLHPHIAAIVTFGDPKRDDEFPGTLQAKAKIICNDGDLICDGLPIVLDPHGSPAYEKRLPEAVSWVKARF